MSAMGDATTNSSPVRTRRRGWAGLCAALALGLPAPARAELPSPLSLMLARSGLAPGAWAAPGDLRAFPAPEAGSVPIPTAAAGGAGPGPAVPLSGRVGGAGAPSSAASRKVYRSRLVGAGVVMAWGLAQWGYGGQGMHASSEGWFGRDTPEGGADKLGHLYTGYVLARGLAGLYRGWGLDADRACREGALSSLLLTTVMEAGDGFSAYGVSGEDMIMNLAGAWAGLELARHEAWRERLDLRVEYRFNREARDIATDYEHARFLAALKLGGFAPFRDTPLGWLELQAGYFARGYDDPLAPDRRSRYVGLGLDLPRLLRRAGLGRAATLLQFYQPPDSSLRWEQAR